MPLFERRAFQAWAGGVPSRPARVLTPSWAGAVPRLESIEGTVLPFGLGRSLGDVCLNNGGTLIDTSKMRNLRRFDEATGILECDGGVTVDELVRLFVPRGWFVPVTPGTKFVTVGGCIANDIHGKNHHVAGTFGRFVRSLELLRSDGSRIRCNPGDPLFHATIGGLGLTGLIVSAEIELRRIASASIDVERIPFHTLDEFLQWSADSAAHYEHTVAWFDALSAGDTRGIFFRGNHAPAGESLTGWRPARARALPMALAAPFVNRLTIGAFSDLYFLSQSSRSRKGTIGLDPFFYPLDAIENWNRVYGREGYIQYQCVIPRAAGKAPAAELLDRVRRSGRGSFLTVMKMFGDARSPGILSFPKPGITLALDFAAKAPDVHPLLDALDDIVEAAGGSVYPAKDSRMSPARFRRYFPQWEELAKHADPHFSSSFWRRVTGDNA